MSGSRVELGGGRHPRPGFVNVDLVAGPGVNHVIDFSAPGVRLPFLDDSVSEVYSAHCLEHVAPMRPLLHEIVRVCHLGASVEIRVPHWLQSMALCQGHKQTISPTQVRHWTRDFLEDWWGGCRKRLDLTRTEHVPGDGIGEARTLFPHFTDDQLMRFVPDCCHEVRFSFLVVPHA